MKFKHIIDDAMHDLSQIKGVSLYNHSKNNYVYRSMPLGKCSPIYIIDGTLTFFQITVNINGETTKTFFSFDSIESFILVRNNKAEFLFNLLDDLTLGKSLNLEHELLYLLARVDDDEIKTSVLPRACARMCIFHNVFNGTTVRKTIDTFIEKYIEFKKRDLNAIKNDLLNNKGDSARFKYYSVCIDGESLIKTKPYDEVNGPGI